MLRAEGHTELYASKDEEELSIFVTFGSELLDKYFLLEHMACASAVPCRQCCNY